MKVLNQGEFVKEKGNLNGRQKFESAEIASHVLLQGKEGNKSRRYKHIAVNQYADF